MRGIYVGTQAPCKAQAKAREWVLKHKTPRQWGSVAKHLMKKTSTGRARCLKAHEGLIALQTGMMAVLARYPGASPEMDKKRKPFARILGDITTCIRALTSRVIRPRDMQRLRTLLNKTWDKIEQFCSYDWLVINTHLLRHSVDLVERNGPMRETWMYAFESAFGINKLVSKNPAFIVSSQVNSLKRKMMINKLKAFRAAFKNESYTKVTEHTLVPDDQTDPAEFFGNPTERVPLTEEEKEHLQNYLCAQYPAYARVWTRYTNYVNLNER